MGQWINIAGSQRQRRFELLLGVRPLTLGPEADPEEVWPARVLGGTRHYFPVGVRCFCGLALRKIRRAQQHVGPNLVRALHEELFQRLDGWLGGSALDVQLGQQKRGLHEVRRDAEGLFQVRFSLLDVPGLQLSHRQLVARRRKPGLEPQHALEGLDRLGRLPPGEMQSSLEESPVEVRGALLEDRLNGLAARVVLSLSEFDLGETLPRWEIVGSLLGDFAQDSLALVGLVDEEVEISQLEGHGRTHGP